jgi:ubiquinone/menaquinone biosynthesis C-methylase UbiE
MVLLGLALARDVCGAALPPVVQARLDMDPVADALAQNTCARLFLEDNATPDQSRITAYRFRMRERWRDRIAYVLRTLCTPREKHLAMVSLPAPLFFLYIPLKLIHDYLLLPAWWGLRPILPAPGAEGGGDTTQAKEAVRAWWTANAPKWDRWADNSMVAHQRINGVLIDAAAVTPGQTVLDLASGVGEPALSIAERLNDDGFVVATDLVPAMLTTTRRRAANEGREALGCCAADMEALPFADAVFDRVVCRLGIMFCPHPEHALAEAHRVLKPGGRAVFLVWGPLEENTIFKTLYATITGATGDLADGGDLTPFRYAATDALSATMRQAGFSGVAMREERIDAIVAPDSRFWQPAIEMTFGDHLAALTPEARALMDRTIEAAFDEYRDEDGYRMTTHVRIAVGTRD